MGLTDIIHRSIGEFIEYEKHSVFYATFSTAVGFAGGIGLGYCFASTVAPYVLPTLAVGIGGYVLSRWVTALPFHLKNIYNLLVGKYDKPTAPAASAPTAVRA